MVEKGLLPSNGLQKAIIGEVTESENDEILWHLQKCVEERKSLRNAMERQQVPSKVAPQSKWLIDDNYKGLYAYSDEAVILKQKKTEDAF